MIPFRKRPLFLNREGEYPYQESMDGLYNLYHDGNPLMKAGEGHIWKYLHTRSPGSITHALKFCGYRIEPNKPMITPVKPDD